MLYYKLKISLQDYEEKLNRTILFKYDNDLDELAFTVLSIFNTMAYHLYMFKDEKDKFECEISLMAAEENGDSDTGFYTYGVTIDQLELRDNKFIMIYDFGESYTFEIEILGQVELKEIYRIPRVVDGVGYGIVEDGRWLLEDYLDGKPLEYPLTFFKRGRLTELDFNSFDLEECNKKLKREISKIRAAYYRW